MTIIDDITTSYYLDDPANDSRIGYVDLSLATECGYNFACAYFCLDGVSSVSPPRVMFGLEGQDEGKLTAAEARALAVMLLTAAQEVDDWNALDRGKQTKRLVRSLKAQRRPAGHPKS